MPITAELFDGTRLEFPDDTDPSVIQSTAKRLTLERTPKKGGIGAAFESGVESFVSPTQTALESITGSPEEAAKRGLERQKISSAKYEGPNLEDIKKIYQEQGFLPAAKKAVSSIPEAISAQIPQLTAIGVGAGIGTIVGGALGTPADIVTGPGGTIAGAAIGNRVGAMIGQAIAEFPQFYGSNIERQAQVQMAQGKPVDINRLKAAGAAGFQTASDIFETQILFGSSQIGKLLGFSPKSLAEKSVESVEKMAKEKLLTTIAKGTAKGAAAEIPNEIFQQMLERAQAGLSVADADAMREYGSVAYQVGLLSPLGIVGSFGERGAARREIAARGITPSGEPIPEPGAIVQPTTNVAEPVTQAGVAPVAPPPIPKIPEITTTPTGMVTPVPPAPVAPPVAQPVAPPVAPPATPLGPNASAPSVEQNRNRSTPASIAQMQGIAANPMYQFVGASNTISGAGAPIVTGPVKIPESHQGHKGLAMSEDGTDIPFHYGVVEAKDLLPSHNADGTPNANYGSDHTGLRAVVGNGRTAGIQESYRKGTADQYVNSMKQDIAHGIDPKVIEGMKEPVLVRYADPSSIPSNIGDLSNTSGTLNLSTVEQAKNDANRIDLTGLNFDENGSITPNTIRQFVASMPTSERANLMDETGNTTRQAHDRLNAAIFHKAYGIDDLTALAHQSEDPEAKNVLKALSESASQMAQLQGTNEYDIRPQVAQAAQLAVNARRNGIKLDDLVKQQDITAHPLTNDILQLFADNPRSSRNIADALKQIATNINEEVNKPAEGLFGAEPKRSVQDIIRNALKKEPTPDLFSPAEIQKRILTYQIDKPKEQIHDEVIKLKDHVELAQWSVDNAPNPFAKAIAEKILQRMKEFKALGIPMSIDVLDGSRRPRGWYGKSQAHTVGGKAFFKISLRGLDKNGKADNSTGTRYSTILHELVHAASQSMFFNNGEYAKKIGKTSEYNKAYVQMTDLLKQIRKQVNKDKKLNPDEQHEAVKSIARGKQYIKNIDELLAYGLTDEKFQHYLSTIKLSNQKTGLSKLIDIIRGLLNINPEYESALDRLMITTDSVFTPTGKEIAEASRRVGIPFGKPETNFEADIKSAIGNKGTYSPLTPDISYESDTVDRITKTAGVKSFGKNIQSVVDTVNKNIRDDDYWTKQRVAFVDKNSGLAKDLASQPVFDMKGQLRADMVARTQDQMLNYVHSGLQMGLPTINSDGTLGIQESENNLARSQILADQLDKKGITDINGKKMSGRDAVAEIARILRGKDVLAEDKARRAKGQLQLAQARALTQELKRLQVEVEGKLPVKTMREYLDAIKYLRKEGYLNKNLNRELQVKERHIKWAEATLKNTPEIKDILDIWKNVNDSLVTLWEKSGLFTKDQADEYRSRENYVPLFKAKEDLENGVNNIYGGAGTKSVKGVKKLQGSEAVRNIWENMNRHYASMVTAAYQNQTRKVATEQLKALGAAEIVQSNNKDVNLRYRDPTSEFADNNGIVSAIVHNPNTLAAFQMMHYELGPIMKAFALSTKALRIGALVNPMYWAKQLIRDPIHATLVGNSGIVTPFHALRDFAQVIAHASPEAKVLASRGVIGAVDPTTDIYDFIKRAGEERKDPNALQRAIHKVMRIHELSDAATRISVYKKAFADAKSKGMSEDQAINFAVHKARESINFAVRGNSKVLNSARHMIPFISAQITSLDSVYRAMFAKHLSGAEKAEAQRAFRNGAMIMTVLSAAYAMAYAGDDDYDKLPDVVKDNNWLIPNPLKEHTFIKIPIPFEVGYLFKSVPEASVRYMQGTSTGKEVLASYKNGLINNIPGGGLSPYHFLPQAIRPIIEIQSNYSNFTGRPIEGMSDQGKPVAFRGDHASEMGKFLSGLGLDKISLSPAKIDYLIQAYTAELGTFSNSMASAALMQAEGKTAPSKNIEELPGFRAFMTNPNSSKAVADFYDLDHKASELYTEFNTLRKTGQGAEAKSLLEDEQQKKLISVAPILRKIQTQMTNIHAQINMVKNNQRMSPDERRDRINQLELNLDKVARQGYKVAESAGINR